MSKTRVYELAKTLEISNKELLEKLKEMGIEAKSHSSGLEEEAVNRVLNAFSKNKAPKAEKKPESKPEVKAEKKPEHKQDKKTDPKQEKKNAPKQEKKAERKPESEIDMFSEDEG
ncbi:MAG: translation initiation factor IF-2 N-terminal domain-containing protein, partial [Clostridia bacterium]|nr:translation initiation factor IF-2 N-terminal domain-containing protein [Clostridia bacterium]